MTDPATAMAESFGEDFMVAGDGYPLKDMILGMLQRRLGAGRM